MGGPKEICQSKQIFSRLIRGTVWLLIGGIVSRVLMLASFYFIARLLGKASFGEFGIIRSTINMFLVFAGFGLGITATKHVAEFKASDPDKAGRIIILSEAFAVLSGLVIAIGMWFLSPWLAEYTLNAAHLTTELRLSAVVLFFNAIIGAQTGALSGFEAFKKLAWINIFVGFISLPVLVTGVKSAGLPGAVGGMLLIAILSCLINHICLRRELRRSQIVCRIKDCLKERKTLWHFSLPAALSGMMVSPVLWACNSLLVSRADGYDQMGIFTAANQWRSAILFVPSMVGQIVLPLLSSVNRSDAVRDFKTILKYNLAINGGAAFLLALPISIGARFIMSKYGPGFADGEWVLVCLAGSSILMAINDVIGQAIAGKSHMWVGFLFNSFWAIAVLGLSILFLSLGFGALGIALGSLISYALHSIWQTAYLVRILAER